MSPKAIHVLTVCQGGNVRSVALAYILKYGCQIDAVACGWEGNRPQTVEMLCKWADVIVVMQPHFVSLLPGQFSISPKVFICDVGPDIWGAAVDELRQKVYNMLVRGEIRNHQNPKLILTTDGVEARP